ncbi:MAG TPA: hypothetical protein VNY05_26920 [Candidatus Acidoferrales bacterium]|jgi:hypothetical protein|nr:hypothetical protein [Candidatus Acidoferrales bacterium]
MQVVLLRVGIDTGSGGIHGPLFSDGSCTSRFRTASEVKESIRGHMETLAAGEGRKLVDYFPEARRVKVSDQSVHFDPEFETFTYGDPTRPKALLRQLSEGSLLVFYAGLKGWNFDCPAALYIIGCFEVARAGLAASFSKAELAGMFQNNFHVMHGGVFEDQKDRLVLVTGNANSRLLKKAAKISSVGTDRNGRPLHRLAPEMQEVFGGFAGNTSIQRSPPRWVAAEFTERAAQFISALR